MNFGLSEALNIYIILAVVLFFSLATDEILKEWWWKKRRQRRKEDENRLHELYRLLIIYPPTHLAKMIQVMTIKTARTEAEGQRTQESMKATDAALEEFRTFTTGNEFRFPEQIRTGLEELRQAIHMTDIYRGHYGTMNPFFERVNKVCGGLREIVEQELKQFR